MTADPIFPSRPDDARPATGHAATLARMSELLDQWEAASDHRAIFLACYSMMTRNMLAAIAERDFHDPEWVRGLLERFAGYYFLALDECAVDNRAGPAAWRLAFEAAQQGHTHVLQHLLLGVNAHINYDLVFCTAEVLRGEWPGLDEGTRQQRHADYCHVNDIIVKTLDAVQDQVVERYSPWMAEVDVVFGRLDEWLITRLILSWRDRVWTHALERLTLEGDEALEEHRRAVEADAVAYGDLISVQDLAAAVRELFLDEGS
jgi:hypothetical protein